MSTPPNSVRWWAANTYLRQNTPQCCPCRGALSSGLEKSLLINSLMALDLGCAAQAPATQTLRQVSRASSAELAGGLSPRSSARINTFRILQNCPRDNTHTRIGFAFATIVLTRQTKNC